MPAFYLRNGVLVPPPLQGFPADAVISVRKLLHNEKLIIRHTFAVSVAKNMFTQKELIEGNCAGHQANKLDDVKMKYIYELTFFKFPPGEEEDVHLLWRDIQQRIDSMHRSIKYKQKKSLVF